MPRIVKITITGYLHVKQAAALSGLVKIIGTDLVRLRNTMLATRNSFGVSVAAVGRTVMKIYVIFTTHSF